MMCAMLNKPSNSIHPRSRSAWRACLERHHTQTEGVSAINDKKATGKPRVEHDEEES